MKNNEATKQVNEAIANSLDVLLSMTGLLNELDYERDAEKDDYGDASMLAGIHSRLLSTMHDVQLCYDLMMHGAPREKVVSK